MKNKVVGILIVFLISALMFSQEDNDFAKRLKALNNHTISFFNVDGADFSTQTFNYEFNDKSLKKLYRKYSIKKSDLKVKDEALGYNNLFITKSENVIRDINQIKSYYFVENKEKTVSVFVFGYYNSLNKEFERKYVNRILNDEIPEKVYESAIIDSIDFAGRKIQVGNSCYWTNVNTVQCPYYGEMNWSVHKTMESAVNAVNNQYSVLKSRKGGKVVSEEEVSVVFEGNDTNAKRIVYGFTGGTALLTTVSGVKTLTVYYVATKVRDNYVSCCMSFWNNDTITERGLAPLLEKVMQLKK